MNVSSGSELIVELQLWRGDMGGSGSAVTGGGNSSPTSWLNEMAWWQSSPWQLGPPLAPPVKPVKPVQRDADVVLAKTHDGWAVSGTEFRVDFSCTTGQIQSWRFGSIELLLKGSEPSYWRPPTDNDYGYEFQKRCR